MLGALAATSSTGVAVGVSGTMTGATWAGGVMASSVPKSTKVTVRVPANGDGVLARPWALDLLRVTHPNGALLARGRHESDSGTIFLPKVDSLTKEEAAIDSIRGISPPSDLVIFVCCLVTLEVETLEGLPFP